MTRIQLQMRYSGQALGIFWALGHPLLLIGVYVVVFGYVLPARLDLGEEMRRTAATYVLAGLIPWMTFSDLLGKASGVIVHQTPLVKHVIFPVDVLPMASTLASFIPQLLTTSILLLYMIIAENHLPLTAALLPILFGLQLMTMLGLCYALSSVAVYFRDLKDVVQVFLSVGLFLAPIVYFPAILESLWAPLRVVLHLNPFSHLVWCYQDILYFGRASHPASWVVVIMLSGLMLSVGYGVFNKLKRAFGEVL